LSKFITEESDLTKAVPKTCHLYQTIHNYTLNSELSKLVQF
jgi:hypothetical protein